MTSLTWTTLKTFTLPQQAVAVPWLMALENFGRVTNYLKLTAKGQWTPMSGFAACGPDGLTGQTFPEDRLLVTDCPVGALIGRIGGSSASLKTPNPVVEAGEGKPFPVGSFTILKLPDKAVGPLFLGFNVLFRPVDLTSLEVTIEGGA